MISKDEVRKLGLLARIEINEKEIGGLQKDLTKILDFISILKKAEIPENAADSTEKSNLKNVLREDDGSHKTADYTEALLKQVPEKENACVKVKKII